MLLSKLYIDHQIAEYPEAKSIQKRLNIPCEIVHNARPVYEYIARSVDPVQKGKETLFLTRNKGTFIRNCPGTRSYSCCGYKILHIGTFCTMDCSYCILQSYFHPPVLQYFVNQTDLTTELKTLFSSKSISRIGTGEFTDSLIWEQWTGLSQILVSKFSQQNSAVLELKTKTDAVSNLKFFQHNCKTIAAWSLNSNKVIQSEEKRTASLSARLKAAAICESWGYPLAFHFDPLVLYDGCEEDYRIVIEQLFSYVAAENIVWISLGTFRYMPDLKPVIQSRFPESRIVYNEFISGLDGKMRYFKPLRIELYRQIISWIREIAPDVMVYFCMEDDEVWKKSFGFIPSDQGGLSKMLDESAIIHCGLD